MPARELPRRRLFHPLGNSVSYRPPGAEAAGLLERRSLKGAINPEVSGATRRPAASAPGGIARKRPSRFSRLSALLSLCAVLVLLLSACQPGNGLSPTPTQVVPTAPLPGDTPVPTAAQPPDALPPTPAPTGLAMQPLVETIPAVPPGDDHPWWEVLPQHTRMTLQGYPLTGTLHQPRIYIFPVAELAAYNEALAKTAGQLQGVLETQQFADPMPFLPPFNAAQMFAAQAQFLDFKSGGGVRYLTQFAQGLTIVNNEELLYTYQGLTSDGQYYVAAVLPVTHPDLPDNSQVSQQPEAALDDYTQYITETTTWLDQQPAGSFVPDLAVLDELVQSISVTP